MNITIPRKKSELDDTVTQIARLPEFEKADKMLVHNGKLIVVTDRGGVYSIDCLEVSNEETA